MVVNQRHPRQLGYEVIPFTFLPLCCWCVVFSGDLGIRGTENHSCLVTSMLSRIATNMPVIRQ